MQWAFCYLTDLEIRAWLTEAKKWLIPRKGRKSGLIFVVENVNKESGREKSDNARVFTVEILRHNFAVAGYDIAKEWRESLAKGTLDVHRFLLQPEEQYDPDELVLCEICDDNKRVKKNSLSKHKQSHKHLEKEKKQL